MSEQQLPRSWFWGLAVTILVVLFYISLRSLGGPAEGEKRRPVRFENGSRSDNWVVCTTINPPSAALKKISGLQGWRLVVVADTKTPKDWVLPNTDFLSVEMQEQLDFKITKLIPFRTYARKNIGYLWAIGHGAKVIYETDDDNELLQDFIPVLPENSDQVRVYQTQARVVNPYAHFGHPSIWPRGFPLEDIANYDSSNPPLSKAGVEKVKISVQQALADGDPDVDAVFRLTRSKELKKIFFDKVEPVALPIGTMCPYNTQNTVYHHSAFWGLLIPITTTFRVCDIWRGYFVQRLLWDIGGHLSFTSASVIQNRNPHNYLLDFEDELQFYLEAGKLVNFLKTWKSEKHSFFDRVQQLSSDMATNGFWKEGDAKLTAAWLEDLQRVGYVPPKLVSITLKNLI